MAWVDGQNVPSFIPSYTSGRPPSQLIPSYTSGRPPSHLSSLFPSLSKLSLLSALSFTDHEGSAGFSAHILEADGSLAESRAPISALVRQLWPEQAPDGYCKMLRLLADWKQRDFLLKPQRKGILARSDIVRAFVEPTRAVFVGQEWSPTYMAFLQEVQGLIARHLEDRSFETSVVESIVCANVTIQMLRWQVLRPVARSSLDNINLNEAEESVLELYPVKAAMSAFTEQVKPIVHGLTELLHSGTEQDAPLGRLRAASSLRPSRQGTPAGSFASSTQDVHGQSQTQLLSLSYGAPGTLLCTADEEHPELEEILESWHNAARAVMDAAQELTSNIEDATRFLDAAMTCTQNRLLRIEYLVMIPIFAMTTGNLIAGIFGMNLSKYMHMWGETRFLGGHALFFVGFASIVLVTLFLLFGLLFFMRRNRSFYQKNAARFGNNKFFKQLGDDAYILSLVNTRDGADAIANGDSSVFESTAVRRKVTLDLKEPAAR